ncbi:MAG: hypothetical protein JNN15_16000 [Blastocatellia bacterium]|nr:hypothetical protein [Blastocatellia bacterium]
MNFHSKLKCVMKTTSLILLFLFIVSSTNLSYAQSRGKGPKLKRIPPGQIERYENDRDFAPRVPRGTQMKVRMNKTIDSREVRNGERFTATVLTPSTYADSTIDGHVSLVKQSGKIKGQTELVLVFDRIRFRNGDSQDISGRVTKVYGEKSAKKVDEEGKIRSDGRGSSTVKRTAGGAAVGAIIGGIAGGGKGAAIGAAVGGGAGAGSNVIRGSNQIKIEDGTEILIKTTR